MRRDYEWRMIEENDFWKLKQNNKGYDDLTFLIIELNLCIYQINKLLQLICLIKVDVMLLRMSFSINTGCVQTWFKDFILHSVQFGVSLIIYFGVNDCAWFLIESFYCRTTLTLFPSTSKNNLKHRLGVKLAPAFIFECYFNFFFTKKVAQNYEKIKVSWSQTWQPSP